MHTISGTISEYIPARLWTSVQTQEVTKEIGNHVDAPDAVGVQVLEKKSALKQRAVETRELPSQLISQMRAGASTSTQGRLDSHKVLARVIRRARKRIGAPDTIFLTRSAIVIPEELQTYETAPGSVERFLLADSGEGDDERILIFGREASGVWIHLVRRVFVDGTFSLAPKLFSQLFLVLGERPGCVLPLAYALLPDKTERSYTRMISLLKGVWPTLNPAAISMDYERGLMNAFNEAFPAAEISGCFFHLVQR
jgi:hypothetical protein